MERHITAPITKETAKSLHAGDYVYVTGTIYTARDAAHKRMDEALDRGEELPIDIKDQAIYYMSNGESKSFSIACFVSFSERLACSVGIIQSIPRVSSRMLMPPSASG